MPIFIDLAILISVSIIINFYKIVNPRFSRLLFFQPAKAGHGTDFKTSGGEGGI